MCLNPIKAYWYGEYTDNNKRKLHFAPISGTIIEEVRLPCGKCESCRREYARNWAIRCVAESKEHKDNYFLTLTYDDDHIKDIDGNVGLSNLEYLPSVCMDDISAFVKRLRSHLDYKGSEDNFRFLASTEYGDKSQRPHAHMLGFGLPIDDLEVYSTSGSFPLYTSATLDNLWKHGNVLIGSFSFATAAYVCQYCLKKANGYDPVYYASFNLEPESLRMSRRPGIGLNYLEKHKESILKDECLYQDGKTFSIPKSFLDRLGDDIRVTHLKSKRRLNALKRTNTVDRLTNLAEFERDYNKAHRPNTINERNKL